MLITSEYCISIHGIVNFSLLGEEKCAGNPCLSLARYLLSTEESLQASSVD